jgi:hypothetical protein
MIASPLIATTYIGSYYVKSMTHAIWVLKIQSMSAFIGCGYGFEVGMGGSTIEGKNFVGSFLKPLLKKATSIVGSKLLCRRNSRRLWTQF